MKDKTKKMKMPHTLVILLIIILISVALTWIIPSGQFERIENAEGLKIIDPNSFHYITQTPVNPLKIFNISFDGFMKVSKLIFVILFAGGAFNIITKSGSLQSLIGLLSNKTKNKEHLFIPILTLIFALICTNKGVNTFIGFAPILMVAAIQMGFDSITGAAIILLGGAVGFSTGTLNVSTTIVAQEIAGLPPYSGLAYRAIAFVAFFIVTNLYLVSYAKKIKKDPTKSPMYELDLERDISIEDNEDFNAKMNLRKWLNIVALFSSLGIIVYGGIKFEWGLPETGVVFIWLAIIAGIISGYGPSEIATTFIQGAKNMVGAALIIGLARTVSGVLDAGNIMDTTIHALSQIFNYLPQLLKGPVLYIANIVINMFITSGSGQAAAIMPIFAPLADTIDVTRQTAVLAYNFGDGFCNYILPTSTALMGILGACNIPYDKWMMFMGKLFGIWVILGSILMVGAQLINYGPF